MADVASPELNENEWRAVSVALNDAARHDFIDSEGTGVFSRMLAWFTGIEARRPLADPRLEAIRAFVCTTRARRAAAVEFVPALAKHGYNDRQIAAMALLAA